jgi:hypothetical protein
MLSSFFYCHKVWRENCQKYFFATKFGGKNCQKYFFPRKVLRENCQKYIFATKFGGKIVKNIFLPQSLAGKIVKNIFFPASLAEKIVFRYTDYYVLVDAKMISVVLNKKPFAAQNWRKSPKIVTVTLTSTSRQPSTYVPT